MSGDSKFAPRPLTASEYVRELFGPENNAAILARNRSTGHTVQTISKAETIAGAPFQSWLASQNASGYEVFMGMNTIKDGAFTSALRSWIASNFGRWRQRKCSLELNLIDGTADKNGEFARIDAPLMRAHVVIGKRLPVQLYFHSLCFRRTEADSLEPFQLLDRSRQRGMKFPHVYLGDICAVALSGIRYVASNFVAQG